MPRTLEALVSSARAPALVACLFLAVAPACEGAKLVPQNLTQLIRQSEQIVAGTVTRVTDGIAADGAPYTEVTIAVASSAKGRVADGSEFTFRQFGLLAPRTMENGHKLLALTPEGFPRWREGESVVAFLFKPAALTGLQTTVGLAQGKLNAMNGSLVNEFNNAGLFAGVEFDAGLLNPEEQNMLTTPGPVDETTFMRLVSRAVSENWIESGGMR